MLYVNRVLKHMIGISSYRFFVANNQQRNADLLYKGMVAYWSIAGVILAVTRSFSFLFWFYFQPLFCMTYFLALINYGFHGFLGKYMDIRL